RCGPSRLSPSLTVWQVRHALLNTSCPASRSLPLHESCANAGDTSSITRTIVGTAVITRRSQIVTSRDATDGPLIWFRADFNPRARSRRSSQAWGHDAQPAAPSSTDRFQERDQPGAVLRRPDAAIRPHGVARHDRVRVGDEAIERAPVP